MGNGSYSLLLWYMVLGSAHRSQVGLVLLLGYVQAVPYFVLLLFSPCPNGYSIHPHRHHRWVLKASALQYFAAIYSLVSDLPNMSGMPHASGKLCTT